MYKCDFGVVLGLKIKQYSNVGDTIGHVVSLSFFALQILFVQGPVEITDDEGKSCTATC